MGRLRKIDIASLPYLTGFLRNFESADPYAVSPGYMAMTGRRGLWLYERSEGGVIVAVHPNRQDAALAFPIYGNGDGGLLYDAAQAIGLPDRWELINARIVDGVAGSEGLLDWQYPAHVLGCERLVQPTGERMRDYRKNLNRAARGRLSYRVLDLHKDRPVVARIAQDWARPRVGDAFSLRDLMEPSLKALDLAGLLDLQGVIVEQEGAPVGFALWEETRAEIACGMVGLFSRPVRGGSEFAVFAQAECLAARGISALCVGGSETASLDAFKRKLCPVRAVVLGSERLAVPAMALAA